MEQHLEDIRPLSSDRLLEMLSVPKMRKNLKLSSSTETDEILENPTARNVMFAFSPTHAKMKDGQLDASNLKAILNNCKVFSGWVNFDTSDGWLQTFHVVAKMRNDSIGHNNSHRIRNG